MSSIDDLPKFKRSVLQLRYNQTSYDERELFMLRHISFRRDCYWDMRNCFCRRGLSRNFYSIKANVVFFLGCLTSFRSEFLNSLEASIKLLEHLDVDYLILGGMDGGPKCGKEVKRRAFAE